jgi:hypothetical protein
MRFAHPNARRSIRSFPDEVTGDGRAVEPRHAAESHRSALDFSDVIVDPLDETVQNTATEPHGPPVVRSPVTRMVGPP